jgi:hypothetical protein
LAPWTSSFEAVIEDLWEDPASETAAVAPGSCYEWGIVMAEKYHVSPFPVGFDFSNIFSIFLGIVC